MTTYKNPLDLANALNQKPTFDKDAIVSFLKQYGTSGEDDAYEQWAKARGKELKKTPLNPEFIGTSYHKQWYGPDRDYTYADQYLADDDWLKEVWDEIYEDIIDYKNNGGK